MYCFCKEEVETVSNLYFYCPNVGNLWNQWDFYLSEDLTLPLQTLQASVFGFSEKDNTENVILYNHLFLIFKLYVSRSTGIGLSNVMSLVNQIMKIKKKKKKRKLTFFRKKGALSIKKMMASRSKVCCLVFLSNTSNYWNKKLLNKKTGVREGRREGGKL